MYKNTLIIVFTFATISDKNRSRFLTYVDHGGLQVSVQSGVGNAGVGKTCLVRRFTQGMFPPGQGATIGVDFMIKTVEIEGEKIKVGLKLSFVFSMPKKSPTISVTRFGDIKNLGHFERIQIVFDKILSVLWQIFYAIWRILIV